MSTLTAARVLGIFWLLLSDCASLYGQNSMTHAGFRHGNIRTPRKVCEDIDVRNRVSEFKVLENCTVIEGSLRILLIEYASEEEYNRLQFPDLVEVTEYILLYRVYGLKTLRHIFPNLSIIRGQRLFYNYALVAYEMMDLDELGLVNLTYIERGAVRLEKNPNLCYVRTIDWTKIAVNVKLEDNFFKGNKNHSECVNICPSNCGRTAIDGHPFPRCWTSRDCQQMLECPRSSPCKTFCYHGYCCHEKCVGGCRGPTVEDCIACKNVTDYVDGKRRCMDRCAPGTYKFRNRRCLRDVECAALNMTLIPYKNEKPGECARNCPAGYTRDTESNISKCVQCKGRCPNICPPKRVDSVTAAQALRDCTIIKGPLEIRITSGSNIGQELEANLGQIEEVMSYVWIHASHSLLSLNFFKSLHKIHGQKLYKQRFSLLVNDNSNLQKLFRDEVKDNLKILNGGILMQFNRKLCYNKIADFVSKVQINSSVDNDISKTNNGDQMPCSLSTLNLTVLQVSAKVAFLRWENFKIPDPRNLLSYVIHYKEAPKQNVTIYDGRDACSGDFWYTKDVLIKESRVNINETYLFEIIVSLKPWTQYAVYVETYTTALAKQGGMSKLVYFRTAATTPTIPFNLNVRARKKGQLHVTWEPPQQPHGNVTHYEVYWRRRELEPSKYEVRDYCHSPLFMDEPEQEKTNRIEDEKKNKTRSSDCCSCPKSNEEMEGERLEREMQIKFQNYLQTVVYIKRTRAGKMHQRRKRDVLQSSAKNDTAIDRPYTIANMTTPEPENVTVPKKSNPFYRAVVMKREFIISNLGHFEDYNIEVIACQERDPRESKKKAQKLCSSGALAVARTLTSKTADNINASSIQVNVLKNKTGDVMIKWKEPTSPNGIIITYEIKFKKADISNVQANVICVTHKAFMKVGGYKLTNLDSGNYTFNIRSTSLAGNGSWTDPKYFIIEAPAEKQLKHEIVIVVCVIVGVVFVIATGIVVWCVARRRFSKYPEIQNVSVNPEYMANYEPYTPDSWEVDRDKVKLLKELGQGSFGMVYKGLARGLKDYPGEINVAVKTVNDSASYSERMSFLSEASIMKSFNCEHVVKLLGVVSEGLAQGKQAYVIMELMSHGDLKKFLRLHRPDEEENDGRQPPTLREIMQMAGEIADGMAYLSDKKFVHRDLAARNCMVAEDYTVKIGDFGMTRDIYETDYYRKGGKGLLPVRWMAPESLKDGIFTSMSDVWSYGVVLWEMATLAAQPYQGLSNEEVLKYVINAKTMDKPEGCPEKLYELMFLCWKFKPRQRPTFKEIIEMLVPDLNVSFKERSFFFSDENKQEILEYGDEFEDVNQDDSNVPFISDGVSEGATGGDYRSNDLDDEDVDFVDIDVPVDYKMSKYDHNRSATASEMCDCILLQETTNPPMGSLPSYNSHNNHNNHTFSTNSNSNSNSAITSSNEGSKESSKSSNSSYAPMNGLNIPANIANGHVPVHMRSPTC